jgi:4-hydroxy-tetrahydrodipicolinate synthase
MARTARQSAPEPSGLGSVVRRGAPSALVISLTPFDARGRVDYEQARAHLRRLRASGIGVYVGGGGSGEGHTLSKAEVDKLLSLAAEELLGHVPVRAMGVEPRTAKQMIAFLGQAKAAGVEAAQIYSLDMGHLASPRPDEMERYFSDVLEHAEIPTIISTHFSVGYLIPIDLLNRLCERFDSVIGVNCSTPDHGYLIRILAELDPRIEVHVGGPMQTLSALAMGATGYLSSEGNLAPKLGQSVITHYAKGDYPAAEAAYTKINRLFVSLGGGAMKTVLRRLGLPGGYPRPPRLPPADEAEVDRVIAALSQLGLTELEPGLGRLAAASGGASEPG